jgi:L-seryl-tRNA(Ser) seleniumtransferase
MPCFPAREDDGRTNAAELGNRRHWYTVTADPGATAADDRKRMAKSQAPAPQLPHDRRRLPSVDAVMRSTVAQAAAARFGHHATVTAVRAELAELRGNDLTVTVEDAASLALARLEAADVSRIRPVYNLTGTVLHTNLGRAIVAETAIAAAAVALRHTVALEYDLDTGRRGDRDDVLRGLLRELTGAEDATAVNNNAAAVLLVLNTLAKGREAIVSRGELIEIGGAFRMPEIMNRAGAKLIEVGTTNRTHLRDYEEALGPKTGVILKVHPSNYRIEGFTTAVAAATLAPVARRHGVPLIDDLGSGTLVDLVRFGLGYEPTVAQAVAQADIVTFSGDKLLGGTQAGFIVGRADLLARINRNPLKRALRVDKARLAALEATLKLYRDPDRLTARLPTLRMLTRPANDIAAMAGRLQPTLQATLGDGFAVEAVECRSEIGSGALPGATIPSAGLAIRSAARRGAGRALSDLALALRRLPMPVIGRIENDALVLDLRCLDDEAGFAANFAALA